jgi:hypothetical protein
VSQEYLMESFSGRASRSLSICQGVSSTSRCNSTTHVLLLLLLLLLGGLKSRGLTKHSYSLYYKDFFVEILTIPGLLTLRDVQ